MLKGIITTAYHGFETLNFHQSELFQPNLLCGKTKKTPYHDARVLTQSFTFLSVVAV